MKISFVSGSLLTVGHALALHGVTEGTKARNDETKVRSDWTP